LRQVTEVAPLTADRLTVDAMEPVADNLGRVLAYIAP
jgi:hypothetical protein